MQAATTGEEALPIEAVQHLSRLKVYVAQNLSTFRDLPAGSHRQRIGAPMGHLGTMVCVASG